jgi:hypothetical protein
MSTVDESTYKYGAIVDFSRAKNCEELKNEFKTLVCATGF